MPRELLDKEDEINIISDDTIVNLKKLILTTIKEDEVTEYIYWHCQKVLQVAKEKNGSKEVARAINLKTLDVLGTVMGELRHVDIDYLVQKMKDTEYVFVVIHNHPSDMHFSFQDIKTFVNADNMTILIVLGNNGSVYVLEKTRQLSLNEVLSIRKELINWKNLLIDFKKVVEQIKVHGIVYSEM